MLRVKFSMSLKLKEEHQSITFDIVLSIARSSRLFYSFLFVIIFSNKPNPAQINDKNDYKPCESCYGESITDPFVVIGQISKSSEYFISHQLQPVVWLGSCCGPMQDLLNLLGLLEKVWRTQDANKAW